MYPIRTIVHPTDFTEHSLCALELARALARDYKAKLVVLHVFPTPALAVADASSVPMPLAMEAVRERILKELEYIQPADPAFAVERLEVEGDPAHEIVRVATVAEADLIVMGTHGRGGLSRLVMGSVAEAVNRKANCPVLTVRPKSGTVGVARSRTAEREPNAEAGFNPGCPQALAAR